MWILRCSLLASLVGCCGLLIAADEPATPAPKPKVVFADKDAIQADEPRPGNEDRKAKFLERLKKSRSEKDGEGSGEGPGDAGGKLGRLKQLKGGRGEPLDKTKFQEKEWKIGEDVRKAYIYAPPVKEGDKKSQKRPLVFAFHGHGGTAENAARRMAFHELWPDAVSVYAQGLPTSTPIDPQGRAPGWQKYGGDQNDRDLAFFDAMLKTLIAEYQIDEDRVYACGHSNGGYMSYVLLAARGEVLAAVAPIAATLDVRNFKDQKPKPVFHVAGERDPLVKYAGQEKTIEQLRKLNGCEGEGKTVGKVVEYTSKNGPPVVAWLHTGGHEIPAGSVERITEFFQQQTRKK
jgi:polyhydroxybutyrate depolymerase